MSESETVCLAEDWKNGRRKWGWTLEIHMPNDWPWRGFGSWRSSSAARRWRPCSPRPWPSSGHWTPCLSSSACGAGWGQRWWPGSRTSSYSLWSVFGKTHKSTAPVNAWSSGTFSATPYFNAMLMAPPPLLYPGGAWKGRKVCGLLFRFILVVSEIELTSCVETFQSGPKWWTNIAIYRMN